MTAPKRLEELDLRGYEDMSRVEIVAHRGSWRVGFSATGRKRGRTCPWSRSAPSGSLCATRHRRSERRETGPGQPGARRPPGGGKEGQKRRWNNDNPLAYSMPESVQPMGVGSLFEVVRSVADEDHLFGAADIAPSGLGSEHGAELIAGFHRGYIGCGVRVTHGIFAGFGCSVNTQPTLTS